MSRGTRVVITVAARLAVAAALGAVAACDDTGAVDGSRGACASGAADCGPVTSPAEACSHLVACGALPLDADGDAFDWGRCVDRLEQLTDDRARLVVACVGASTCDELRTSGSPDGPYGAIYCLALGGSLMTLRWVATGATLVALATPGGSAMAQAGEVSAWIAMIEAAPAGMDRATWKEKRRDAARRLAASGDPRAVPVLIRLVETESFDIIGEIAIDGLGQIGDRRAVPALHKVAADPSRDRPQRDRARKALARLGADPEVAPAPAPTAEDAAQATSGGPGPAPGPATADPVPTITGPAPTTTRRDDGAFADDVLAASERVTFAIGGARLGYDTVRERTSVDGDLAARYQRRIDKRAVAWRYGGDAALVAGTVDPDGVGSSRGAVLDAAVRGEGRGYTGSGLYAVGAVVGGLQTTYLALDRANPDQDDIRDVRTAADVGIELGGGWGRVLDVGSRLRARRLATALQARGALGRPIDDAVAARLQRVWWSLRGELGAHRRLTATVAVLRDAGILLGEPDAGLSYELLEVLRDPALDDRASGFDVQLVFSESYLLREEVADSPLRQDGRLEELRLRAAYGRQLPGDTSDVTAEGFARLRVLAGDGVPAPWAVGATARLRRFAYGEHLDPSGALDLSATVAASDDDLAETDLGARIGAGVGWSVAWSRASWIRVGGDLAVDSGELFVGLTLDATYGLLDASYARSL